MFENENTLIPAIIQDATTKNVLMLGYMNKEAFEKTKTEKTVTFFSRSKNRLWTKGETSGNFLKVHDIATDCDNDTILIRVIPTGPVCHNGTDTCFNGTNKADVNFIEYLEDIIKKRIKENSPDSYTCRIHKKGINKIAQKVGEEAVELIIEAKDSNDNLFVNEAADLMYHYLLLLTAKGFSIKDVAEILKKRHK
ncbi:MAG: bifunctional phosphoribosyl-AMP cyclohydrolase/phosphoribosyl-ATP diphosphatase [Bacteroidetes bacterium GWE2_29_8]|nr:MAG: bifunctional phosphoribosyl-AMP cyclohydrolase/phosphoribosyl-ATP diphosphatase [Bacteroidetes bacterium GWE2_29_8]OFY14451.1 MAG: bifunctional phosphoribosyl-AMP cyclohydrolase/phosphoribosyl-ATP diphosphatase [Bacteroidetes bacterium GWF2_29_10]